MGRMAHQFLVKALWEEEELAPFDELILSWNGERPREGVYHFYVSVKVATWSSWVLYASWGSEGQSSFETEFYSFRVFQDILRVRKGWVATGFRIKVVMEGDASLDRIYALHVYTNSSLGAGASMPSVSMSLKVRGVSQMALDHPRRCDFCSPSATVAVVRYLLGDVALDPIQFGQNVWDRGFNIFGNWAFNVAEASTRLGSGWNCWVERLDGVGAIIVYLKRDTPVVVSVKGPLKGGALPYENGHLLVVTGFDVLGNRVLCMDPAFATDEETNVSYEVLDFVQAWEKKGRVAYIFMNKSNHSLEIFSE